MNETTRQDGTSGVPWQTNGDRLRRLDEPMTSGYGQTPSGSPGALDQAVHGVHDTLDRLADRAATAEPARVEDAAAAGTAALDAKRSRLRAACGDGAASLRGTVRGRPLTCVAAAAVLGLVIARLSR